MTLHRLILVSLISIIMTAVPSLHADTVGTAFTYQGVLSDAGAPVEGDYDFRVFLYNADVGGGQVGTTVLVGNVTVTDGRVALDLDFGDVFDGTALWLEIHLRETGTTTYASLLPRQRLTATPFSNHAAEAVNAAQFGGQNPAYYLAWSNITGVPADLSNGDDDTLADLSCTAGEIAKWNGSTWACGEDVASLSTSTYVVGPVGTATENGAALLAAAAAMPGGAQSRLEIEPGIYDLVDQSLTTPPSVYITGSNWNLTRILSAVCGTATVVLSSYSELHGVWVENSCADGGSSSIGIEGAWGATISDVYVRVQGDALENYAVRNPDPYFSVRNSEFIVSGGTSDTNIGFQNLGANAELDNVQISAGSAAGEVYGIRSWASITLTDVQASAGNGGGNTYGVYIQAFIRTRMARVQAKASSIAGDAFGIYLQVSNDDEVEIKDVTASASDQGSGVSYGLYLKRGVPTVEHAQLEGEVALFFEPANEDLVVVGSVLNGSDIAVKLVTAYSGTLTIEHSRLFGGTSTIDTTEVSGTATVSVAGGRLAGGGIAGAATCAGVWDENYVFYPSTCP